MHAGPTRLVPLGQNPGFVEVAGRRDAASAEEPAGTEQSGGIRSRRKRRDLGPAGSEDEFSKLASTCSGNDLVCASLCYLIPRAGFRGEEGCY